MKSQLTLLPGEYSLDDAPVVRLTNGQDCVPQQFYYFSHTRETVEQLVFLIQFDKRYPIFVGESNGALYLQIGIIGPDNYGDDRSEKIVYGRKWRIEPELPTSELIQTVYLAIQKAREHEVRELLQVRYNHRWTTPFNNHQDLPLMANNADLLKSSTLGSNVGSIDDIERKLLSIRYDGSELTVKEHYGLPNGRVFLELCVVRSEFSRLPEMSTGTIPLLLSSYCVNNFLYTLMDALLDASNRYIDEHFLFDKYARFSRINSVDKIAELSSAGRNIESGDMVTAFSSRYEFSKDSVDANRVPVLLNTRLTRKLKQQLNEFEPLQGFVPKFVS